MKSEWHGKSEEEIAHCVSQQNVGHEMKAASGRFRTAKGAPLEPWGSPVEISATGCCGKQKFS